MNLDTLDPDWQFARIHGKATKIGIPVKSKDKEKRNQVCPCCFNVVEKQEISMKQNTKQLHFLGFGFPLFYSFLKYCCILLIIQIACYNGAALRNGFLQNQQFCQHYEAYRRMLAQGQPKHCTSWMVQISRITNHLSPDQTTIRILTWTMTLLTLIFIRNMMIKKNQYFDERTNSMEDYSILIRDLPKINGIQAKIRQFFKRQFKQKHEIRQLTLLNDLQELFALKKQKKHIINKLRPYYDKKQLDDEYTQIDKQLFEINGKISSQIQEIKNKAQNDVLQAEKAIIVFTNEDQRDQILKQFKEMNKQDIRSFFDKENKCNITFKRAPQPNQIIWQNVSDSSKKHILRLVIGWFLWLLTLIIVFIAVFFILGAKVQLLTQSIQHLSHLQETDEDYHKYLTQYNGAIALVYILLFLVVLFNKLPMVTLFHKLTDFQRHETQQQFQFSFCLKYCLGLFFTTALMTLAVEDIRFNNYFSHPYGVVEEETVMFFMNAFFVPLFWLINPLYQYKRLKRRRKQGKRSLTQRQANQLMQESIYDNGKRYAEIVQTMWFVFLYSTLIPIGAVISLAGILLYFWVDKFNLLRRSRIPLSISGKLSKFSLYLIDLVLVFKPMGSLIFDANIREKDKINTTVDIILLVLGVVYFLLPKNRIIRYFYPQKFFSNQFDYDEIKHKLIETYHNKHPAYDMIHGERLRQKMSMENKISFTKNYSSALELNQAASSKFLKSKNNVI